MLLFLRKAWFLGLYCIGDWLWPDSASFVFIIGGRSGTYETGSIIFSGKGITRLLVFNARQEVRVAQTWRGGPHNQISKFLSVIRNRQKKLLTTPWFVPIAPIFISQLVAVRHMSRRTCGGGRANPRLWPFVPPQVRRRDPAVWDRANLSHVSGSVAAGSRAALRARSTEVSSYRDALPVSGGSLSNNRIKY